MEQRSESPVKFSEPEERRSEPRIKAGTSVIATPLASVATRLQGLIVNVSKRGVMVHFATRPKELPRAGTVYRLQSGDDLMLCEVRHSALAESGANLGLQIVHWGDAGALRRLVQST